MSPDTRSGLAAVCNWYRTVYPHRTSYCISTLNVNLVLQRELGMLYTRKPNLLTCSRETSQTSSRYSNTIQVRTLMRRVLQ